MTRARSVANRGWQATRRNLLINGGMQVWQRGASGALPLNAFTYTADRWCVDAAGAALNWSQGQSPGNALRTSGSLALLGAAGNTGFGIHQRIEGGTAWPLAGKKLTLSVKLFSSSARTFRADIGRANSLDDFSGRTLLESKDIAVHPGGDTWITAAVTFDAVMPAQCAYGLYVSIVGAALVGGATVAIADVQLEVGEEATDFEILPIGETQTLCERYYRRSNGDLSSALGQDFGDITNATVHRASIKFNPTMRTAPIISWGASVGATGFPATAPTTIVVTAAGLCAAKTSTATGGGGSWYHDYIANAEL